MDFIKDKIYFLPKLNCKIRFIEKATNDENYKEQKLFV